MDVESVVMWERSVFIRCDYPGCDFHAQGTCPGARDEQFEQFGLGDGEVLTAVRVNGDMDPKSGGVDAESSPLLAYRGENHRRRECVGGIGEMIIHVDLEYV